VLKIKHELKQMMLTYDHRLLAITKEDNKFISSKDLNVSLATSQSIKLSYGSTFKSKQIAAMAKGLSHMIIATKEG